MHRNWMTYLASPLGIGTSLLMVTAVTFGGYLLYLHATIGPLSAQHSSETPLGGYSSHAEFQQECTYCHGPIHCIVDNRCQTCHIDIAKQRAEAIGLHGLLPRTSDCQNCHPEHQGRDTLITRFAFTNVDHTLLADFSLDQHHTDYEGRPLDCESCHQLGRFGPEALDCFTCHSQNAPDLMSQHQEQYGEDCLVCHDGHDRLANFDHNQSFALNGAHTAAVCESCHVNQTYVGTTADCAACHIEPELHAGQFGLECERCHNDLAWSPAQLTRHTFPLNHGQEEPLGCENCHLNTYTEYLCENCHLPVEMISSHPTLSAAEIGACLACHPAGQINSHQTEAN